MASILLLTSLAIAPSAEAYTSFQNIQSAGPITDVLVGKDLSCQFFHKHDIEGEAFPPFTYGSQTKSLGDCGTFLRVGSTTYGPDFLNHRGATTQAKNAVDAAWSLVSQTGISYSGSTYSVTTVANAGSTGLRATQTDTYAPGTDFVRTSVNIQNTGPTSTFVILYRAVDCYLSNSDRGQGEFNYYASGEVACTNFRGAGQAKRSMELDPVSSGSQYQEAFFADIWSQIEQGNYFTNTVRTDSHDVGMGLSWGFTLPGYSSITKTSDMRFRIPPVATCQANTIEDSRDAVQKPGLIQGSARAHHEGTSGTPSTLGTDLFAQPYPLGNSQHRDNNHGSMPLVGDLFLDWHFIHAECGASAYRGTSSSSQHAVGSASLGSFTIRDGSTQLMRGESLQFDAMAYGTDTYTRGAFRCFVGELQNTLISGMDFCTTPNFGIDLGPLEITINEQRNLAEKANPWLYGGSMLHIRFHDGTEYQDVRLGSVIVGASGGTPYPAQWVRPTHANDGLLS